MNMLESDIQEFTTSECTNVINLLLPKLYLERSLCLISGLPR